MLTDFPLVLIRWIDIQSHENSCGYSVEKARSLEVAEDECTMGYLLTNNQNRVRIGNDFSPRDKLFRRVDVFPKSVVFEIVYLTKVVKEKKNQ